MAKQTLEQFLADQDEATKARYAETLAEMDGEFRKPTHFEYAESLVYFGRLERKVFPLYQGPHIRGSRTKFRRVA